MLIAKPKSTSCITGNPIIIAKVSRSRRTWTNSFTTTAAKRLQANTAISPPPGRSG